MIKGFARSFDGLLDIGAMAFRDLRQDFAGGGIVSGEGFAGNGIRPFAVDQHRARLLDKIRDLRMNLR